MKIKNVWDVPSPPLEKHDDDRGSIVDVFYNESIDHVATIKSTPNCLRGNHYHKETTQHILITAGSLEYWYKPVGSAEPAKYVVANVGDMVSTPSYEIHALVIREDGNEFIVFSQGPRGGSDYESDTFRVESIIPENRLK